MVPNDFELAFNTGLRKKAEQILADKSLPLSLPENRELLIRELQIHQIELELQNEELRLTQLQLEISCQRFSDFFEWAPTGYLTVNKNGNIDEINRTVASLLGYSKSELCGKHISSIATHEDKNLILEQIQNFDIEIPLTCTIRLCKKDGSMVATQWLTTALRYENQDRANLLVAIIDITTSIQVEEIRSHLAAIVEGTNDAIISVTLSGIISSWNLGAEFIYGYSAEEVQGLPLSLLMAPNGRDEMPMILRKIAAGRQIENSEVIHRKKDGSLVPVAFSASAIRTSSGAIIGASTIARNITERRRWEDSILELNQQLQTSNRELESLGRVLSHDLRGQIRAISGSTRILSEVYCSELSSEGMLCLHQIIDRANHMDKIVDGLLNLSTISHKRLLRNDINLSNLTDQVSRELLHNDPYRDVEFIIQPDLIATGEESLLHMVIENLLRNAWKFSSLVNHAIIEFGQTESKGKTAYFVRDNGAGFNMALSSRLFTAFESLHPASEFSGTGIGLETVKRIVVHHGGDVWAEGEVNKGATFYFTLC